MQHVTSTPRRTAVNRGVALALTAGLAVTGLTVGTGITAQAAGACAANAPRIFNVPIKLQLQGSYNAGTGRMGIGVLTNGYLPATEPYSALGYRMRGGENKTTTATSANVPVDGTAVVDWILVELRDAADFTKIIATDAVTLGQNGLPTTQPSFAVKAGNYFVAVEHRNHLGLMTAAPVTVGATTTLTDFSDNTLAVYDTGAGVNGNRRLSGTVSQMVAGEATHIVGSANNQVRFSGTNNDHDPGLARLGGDTTAVVSGYFVEDFNLDGRVRYSSASNDDNVLRNGALGGDSTKVLDEQLPVGVLGAASVCAGPTITLVSPAAGTIGTPYRQPVTFTGDADVSFTSTGTLPAGLTLDPATGIISGTPTVAGTSNFTVTATNSAGSDTRTYALTVGTPPVITSGQPPTPKIGTPYTAPITATGTGPITYAITGGALPTGFTLDPITGVVAGNPTTVGTFTYTVTATSPYGSTSVTYSQTVIGGTLPVVSG